MYLHIGGCDKGGGGEMRDENVGCKGPKREHEMLSYHQLI